MDVTQYGPRTDADATFLTNTRSHYTVLPHLQTTLADHDDVFTGLAQKTASELRDELHTHLPDDTEIHRDSDEQTDAMGDWDTAIRSDSTLTLRTADGTAELPSPMHDWLSEPADTYRGVVAALSEQLVTETANSSVVFEGFYMPMSGEDSFYKTLLNVRTTHPQDGDDLEHVLTVDIDSRGVIKASTQLLWYDTGMPYVDELVAEITPDAADRWANRTATTVTVGSYAAQLATDTTLSPQEALVSLFDDLDYTDREIGAFVKSSRSTVASVKQRAREKYDDAPERIAKNEATMRVFDDYSADAILSGEWET